MTKDDVARAFIVEGARRGITVRGQVMAIACGLVESNLTIYANSKVPESLALPHEAVGSDGYSVGPLQQQVRRGSNGQWWWGDARTCMDPTLSVGLFYGRLAQLDYNGTNSPGSYVQAIQRSAYPGRYDERWSEAQAIHARLAEATPTVGGGPVGGSLGIPFGKYRGWKGDPVWLPEVLRAAGLPVIEHDGWRDRGHGDFREVIGVLCHHTAGGGTNDWRIVQNGRPDLEGPLAQLVLEKDGTYRIIAAGVCWHAGRGRWPGWPADDANWQVIGIEAVSRGTEPWDWTPIQLANYRVGCAAIMNALGRSAA